MRDIVHFAHGNGFPSGSYRQLLNALQVRFDCFTVDRLGHNPQFPVTDNWPFLVHEIIDSIKGIGTKPVIGIGHSLGGVLTLLAAIEDPSLFKAVIMIDSPLLNRFKSSVVSMAKKMNFIDHITPANKARGRRKHWATQSELSNYLKTRPLFETFDEACLNDYIEFGFEKNQEGYTLRFDPDVEYHIFRTLPHQLNQYEGQLKTPTAIIYGQQSKIVMAADVRYMQKKYAIKAFSLPGTHMLPMEHPQQLARQIFSALDAII